MSEKNKQTGISLAVVSVIVLIAAVMGTGCKKQPDEPIHTEHLHAEPPPSEPITKRTGESEKPDTEVTSGSPSEPLAQNTNEPAEIDIKHPAIPKLSLNDIIEARRNWDPYIPWYGKAAPDFTLTDTTGKDHKLSDYRGKNVLLVFWATWCPPCQMMVPHLIQLRKTFSEDNLAIWGISYITSYPPNTAEMIKKFAEIKKTNYTIFATDVRTVPAPYNTVISFPSIFFIDTEGKIKLVIGGALSSVQMMAVLQAE